MRVRWRAWREQIRICYRLSGITVKQPKQHLVMIRARAALVSSRFLS